MRNSQRAQGFRQTPSMTAEDSIHTGESFDDVQLPAPFDPSPVPELAHVQSQIRDVDTGVSPNPTEPIMT